MPNSDLKVSVIIPNLHSPVIGQVLSKLRRQDYDLSQVEVLVVGLDCHRQVLDDDLVQFISTGRPIPPAQARNLGVAAARGRTLVFLDADCVPADNWLRALLETAAQIAGLGALSGAMDLAQSYPFLTQCDQIATFHEYMNSKPAGFHRSLPSFSLLVPRFVMVQVGGFDTSFVHAAGEDLDLTIRISRAGYRLYFTPEAVVAHYPSRSTHADLWRHAYIIGYHSISVRRRYAETYSMPRWSHSPWTWRVLSPAIALARTVQILSIDSALWRYAFLSPWVFLSKMAWCFGAAQRLAEERGAVAENGGA
jgi:cellulose synthase/poly-beta-1,6-N-acetylglucosamine synthase-like glycosyltransferase